MAQVKTGKAARKASARRIVKASGKRGHLRVTEIRAAVRKVAASR